MFNRLGLYTVALFFLVWSLGDLVWLMFVCLVSGEFAWAMGRRWQTAIPVTIAVAILALHAAGFKVAGSPALRDNRPVLANAWVLDYIETPNVLVATDGSRHTIPGVEFPEYFASFPKSEHGRFLDPRTNAPVHFAADPKDASGYVFEKRIQYWCGNTWFPQLFPKRLPMYHLQPGSEVFVHYKIRKPVKEGAKEVGKKSDEAVSKEVVPR